MKRPMKAGLIAVVVLSASAAFSAATLINFETGYFSDRLLSDAGVELLDAEGDVSGVRLRGREGTRVSLIGRSGRDGLPASDGPRGTGDFVLSALQPFEPGFGGPQPFLTLDFTDVPRARRVSGGIWSSGSAVGWSAVATFSDGSTATTGSPLFPALRSTGSAGGAPGVPSTFSFDGGAKTVSTIDISLIPGDEDEAQIPPGVEIDDLTVAAVPIPLGGLLLLTGLGAMAALRRRRAA